MESSRSSHQRGVEHVREILNGTETHLLVLHYMEEHNGERQHFFMRVKDHHKKALERQVLESVRIEEGRSRPEENLNLKSEWAASKLPGIQVRIPKGTRKLEDKRIRYNEGSED